MLKTREKLKIRALKSVTGEALMTKLIVKARTTKSKSNMGRKSFKRAQTNVMAKKMSEILR